MELMVEDREGVEGACLRDERKLTCGHFALRSVAYERGEVEKVSWETAMRRLINLEGAR